jgi:hypothetical protein
MSAIECYKEYTALRSHFNDKYDYIKYCGKIKVNPSTFESRKDKLFFQKLAKHTDVKNFLVANFSVNEKLYIRDLAYSEKAEKVYKDWLKKQQSLSYVFKTDLAKLDSDFDKNFVVEDNNHPLLLKKYLGNEICLETICLLVEAVGCKKYWDKKLQLDFIWDSVSVKIEKYSPFIVCDRTKIKKIVIDYFTEKYYNK